MTSKECMLRAIHLEKLDRLPVTIPQSRCGFTLIEILVVVAIIGLLISILLPSLKAAREQSKRAVCLSNEHQMGIGFGMYAAEFRQYLPLRDWFSQTA